MSFAPSPQPDDMPPPRPQPSQLRGSIAFGLLMAAGLIGAATPPPAEPRPPHIQQWRKATPEESVVHQLQQAYELDQIRAGQR